MAKKRQTRSSWFFKMLLILVSMLVLISLLIVVPFKWINPPYSMVMLDRWWSADQKMSLQQAWLPWQQIPSHAALAVVASEDQRFPSHHGFDVEAIQQALSEWQREGALRGASTISQQVARNMYLWTGRSWLRKGLEAWFTVLIELIWGKQRILEVYLNIAEWGPGVFGLQAAAFHHFDRPASQLTPMQAALLASTLPSPLRYDPVKPAAHIQQRARWNLEQQRKLGGSAWLADLS
ncbi:Monofunctional biosynthetic peptidoglycan transglycosylase [Methylophaga frappieri]|uniref:Biosynthetic peptidoglycan transglycosylase n=1 Tax=Methylophaga frappieri (strain ATCC BAA-2434 / DSM 25690 / JAM7) TaxID=754477 RepID=I1YL78_METFJ|nr:monofunctional biosynthetic peptidoglycan transglycosylase [Methylophaga frappieri]AFJ03671.1 Monofunctional biosynthetic peptidoglycan transglycosylase [Methylophaga frappieri]